jgi:hypothetical protein
MDSGDNYLIVFSNDVLWILYGEWDYMVNY